MRRSILALIAVAALSGGYVGVADAADDNSSHDGQTAHTHHVHKGNGECEDIDEQTFAAEHRGLHQGANQSGSDRGPWHGTCANHSNH
jgi:hypothetical protein